LIYQPASALYHAGKADYTITDHCKFHDKLKSVEAKIEKGMQNPYFGRNWPYLTQCHLG